MPKMFISVVSLLALLAAGATPVSAQEPPPTPAELTLRPGDTITWSTSGPHRLRFGGTVTHGGANLSLTPFADVQKVLDLNPALSAGPDGVAMGGVGATVTATVKANAATQGVAEFFFTCGHVPHNGIMVTVPFKIDASGGQPARNLQIVSANPPRWVLKDAPDKNMNRP
jgi:hypothetical protein